MYGDAASLVYDDYLSTGAGGPPLRGRHRFVRRIQAHSIGEISGPRPPKPARVWPTNDLQWARMLHQDRIRRRANAAIGTGLKDTPRLVPVAPQWRSRQTRATPAQIQMMRELALHGVTQARIAELVGFSVQTVRNHVRAVTKPVEREARYRRDWRAVWLLNEEILDDGSGFGPVRVIYAAR